MSRKPITHPSYPHPDSHFEPIHVSIDGDPNQLLENASTRSRPLIKLLTIAEAAKVMNVSVTSVRRLQQARKLPFFKVGRAVRFAHTDILSYLESRRIAPVD
jgi:excisionase family DNA binding protein